MSRVSGGSGGGGGGGMDSSGGGCTNGLSSASQSPGNIVRNLLVHISGNRATWEHMGIHGALWQVF